MDKPVRIYFVTWPDGKLFEGTQTSTSESIAIGRAIHTWLIPQFFPGLDLGGLHYGPMRTLWDSMLRAGFKVQSVETNAEGISA
ncbi:hypothetical protein [Allorhizobium ampelinum]|uniref:hypothetical protein n=1 Tax=Allorhizobium ampelinum TaxID=3025782 RepID=UPI000B3FF622|nr:hypothetical protein [Allorhizobium ampelinum]NTA27423.1 hypothetical protein [Allorhizobium ampelinum]OVE94480.1 hypothetical protein B7W85_13085 [Allorhizobium ampelinum]